MLNDNEFPVEVLDVTKHFAVRGALPWSRARGFVRAVDGISMRVPRGETVALVGESGCGKTTAGNLILGLISPTSGVVKFEGEDISTLKRARYEEYRGAVQAVFQDPWSSLNPRMRVGEFIGEPLRVLLGWSQAESRQRAESILDEVGLGASQAGNYPHEFSGGQRQRIAIGRALAPYPRVIVLDEPVSSLDVSIRAQILNLLATEQSERGVSYVFISHNLASVRYASSWVGVMYLGKFAETGETDAILSRPLHPYTSALLQAELDPRSRRDIQDATVLPGEVPSPMRPPSGCRFHPRCPLKEELGHPSICSKEEPPLYEHSPNRHVACHFFDVMWEKHGAEASRKTQDAG